MKRAIHHSFSTVKEALQKLDSGWTHAKVAKKYKVHLTTVYGWQKRFSSPNKTTTKTTVTNVKSTNNLVTATNSELIHKVSITFGNDIFTDLKTLATREVRTVEDQVKYLVLLELERVKRNRVNIPL